MTKNKLKNNDINRHDYLCDNNIDVIQIVGNEGKIIDANRDKLKTLGYTKKEFIGRFVTDTVHPKFKDHINKMLKKLFQGKMINSFEICFIGKLEKQIFLELNAFPVMAEGESKEAIVIMRKIKKFNE